MITIDNMSKVGPAISQLREARNMDVDTLASILLIRPEHLIKIEAGELIPEDNTVTLLSNVFGIRKRALEMGNISSIDYSWTPESALQELENSMKVLYDQTHVMLEELQDLRMMDRYRAEPFFDEAVFYVIRDNDTGKLLTADTGEVYRFSGITQAMNTAYQLENGEIMPDQIKYFEEFQDDIYQGEQFKEMENEDPDHRVTESEQEKQNPVMR